MTEATSPHSRVLTVVVPVYRNAASLTALCERLVAFELPPEFERRVIFVIDGSPDQSAEILRSHLECSVLNATIVELSRNFGSFAAIRAGLEHAQGDYFTVISADLQAPRAHTRLVERLRAGDVDLVLGRREGRADPLTSRMTSAVFWRVYRRWVQPPMPTYENAKTPSIGDHTICSLAPSKIT